MNLFELDYYWLQYWIAQRPRPSVLVVEDDILLKPSLARILYSVDDRMNLRWAKSFAEARQALADDLPDLVVCDCLLGAGGTGLDLWRHCQEENPDVAFLMITGLSPNTLEKLDAKPLRSLPPVLQKPFLPSECRREVKLLLDLRS